MPRDFISQPFRILLVDDNPGNILVAGTLLEECGYDFEIANNGSEAVVLFKEKGFSLILMDLQMPVLNGIDAAREIRMYENLIAAKPAIIIAVTANDSLEMRRICHDAGMNDIISKPYYPALFCKKLSEFIDS